jgi:hypothetical protein
LPGLPLVTAAPGAVLMPLALALMALPASALAAAGPRTAAAQPGTKVDLGEVHRPWLPPVAAGSVQCTVAAAGSRVPGRASLGLAAHRPLILAQ